MFVDLREGVRELFVEAQYLATARAYPFGLAWHWRPPPVVLPFACPCGASFDSDRALALHERTRKHGRARRGYRCSSLATPYECSCGESFATARARQAHATRRGHKLPMKRVKPQAWEDPVWRWSGA